MYDVVYADPPWEYRQSGTTKSARGIAKKYYPTMATSDVRKMELFAREKAPGWDVWGLEVQDDVAL